MTPTQLAIAECANYDQGRCLGVVCGADLTAHPFPTEKGKYTDRLPAVSPKPRCDVMEKRCGYFEECVLPLADSPSFDPELRLQCAKARDQYRASHGMSQRFTNYRKCECGREIGRRVKYCPTCAKNIRRENKRKLMAEARKLAAV